MYHHYDPDEWTVEVKGEPCKRCNGDSRKCNGMCSGWMSYGQVRRPQAEIDQIKAEKERKREDAVLAEAAFIKAKRGIKS